MENKYSIELCSKMLQYCAFAKRTENYRASEIKKALERFFDVPIIEEAIKTLIERSDNSDYTASPKLPSFNSVMREFLSMQGRKEYDEVKHILAFTDFYMALKKLGNFT